MAAFGPPCFDTWIPPHQLGQWLIWNCLPRLHTPTSRIDQGSAGEENKRRSRFSNAPSSLGRAGRSGKRDIPSLDDSNNEEFPRARMSDVNHYRW